MANTVEYILSLKDQCSGKLTSIGIANDQQLATWAKVQQQVNATNNTMKKYGKHAIRQQGAKIVLFQFDKWDAKFAKEVKNLIGEKVHGKYFITGNEDKIYDF
ncbi:MAG: hypothetical protein RR293_08555 [Bacteroidales bacterium]